MCLNITWFAGILLFLTNIDRNYLSTFCTFATGKANCQRIFSDAKTDEMKLYTFTDSYFLWRHFEDRLQAFVKEGGMDGGMRAGSTRTCG